MELETTEVCPQLGLWTGNLLLSPSCGASVEMVNVRAWARSGRGGWTLCLEPPVAVTHEHAPRGGREGREKNLW